MKQNSAYITVTGLRHYHGSEFIEPKMTVRLVKEPDNEYDREAIRVEMEGIGTIGYVANSVHTVQGESYSAGRIYDRIGDTAKAKVKLVLPRGLLCKVKGLAPLPPIAEGNVPERKAAERDAAAGNAAGVDTS